MRYLTTILILVAFTFTSRAQDRLQYKTKHLRVSLITCGHGEEIYSVFGHSAIRILDSNMGTDIVYNYGTFDGFEENFELKFMQGKLPYYISTDNYIDFVEAYKYENRWIKEQVLNLNIEEQNAIKDYLERNMLPENRAYKYDFFFDNCATRIRDIFYKSLGKNFVYGNAITIKNGISFRTIINQYLQNNKWTRLGINILLGSKIDALMTNEESMFLPDFLQKAIATATLNNKTIIGETIFINQTGPISHKANFSIYIALYALLAVVIISAYWSPLKWLKKVLFTTIMLLSGLLGVLLLIMWFATDHQACADNFNLLWLLPTNIYFAFRQAKYKYSLIAAFLIFLMLIIHITGIQQLLFADTLPILLILLFIFGHLYLSHRNKTYEEIHANK